MLSMQGGGGNYEHFLLDMNVLNLNAFVELYNAGMRKSAPKLNRNITSVTAKELQ